MRKSLLVAWCLALGNLIALRDAAAGDLAVSPQPGVLLLNNGELIAGTITPAGDRYDVQLKDGELHLKRSEVSLVCRNAEECYLHKRAGIEPDRVGDHLELAEWCLRNSLRESAEKEIVAARLADPTHPRIPLIEARLRLAKEDASRPPAGTSPEKAVAKEPSQLDRMVRNLPAGTVEGFTNTVQPLLLNYCSRSGCHTAQANNGLRLERVSIRLAGRHPTQRNLQAALALVNPQSPEESKLLQMPIRPHGTLKLPIFTDREQSQYKQLVQWVYLASNRKAPPAPASLVEHGAPLLQTLKRDRAPDHEPLADDSQVQPASAEDPIETGQQSSDWSDSFPDQPADAAEEQAKSNGGSRSVRSQGQIMPRSFSKRGAAEPEFAPKDPFDPAIFNRRYFGQ